MIKSCSFSGTHLVKILPRLWRVSIFTFRNVIMNKMMNVIRLHLLFFQIWSIVIISARFWFYKIHTWVSTCVCGVNPEIKLTYCVELQTKISIVKLRWWFIIRIRICVLHVNLWSKSLVRGYFHEVCSSSNWRFLITWRWTVSAVVIDLWLINLLKHCYHINWFWSLH